MLQRFICFCALLGILVGCGKTPAVGERKPLLLVSIAPYKFLVEQVAGDAFEVSTVVPVAANPHSFEPTARQVQEISRGVVWFRIGEPFEKKVMSVLEKRAVGLGVVDLRDGIAMIEDCGGCVHCSVDHLDRHIWLSPKLAGEQAALIERVLSERFPEKAGVFRENLARVRGELGALDREIAGILKDVKKRTLLVSHPAFGYFCRDYGLQQMSIEHEGKEPRPRHLEEILRRAVSESAEVALAMPQHNNKGAQVVAERLKMPVRLIDPYSADYLVMMRKLAHLIAEPHAD